MNTFASSLTMAFLLMLSNFSFATPDKDICHQQLQGRKINLMVPLAPGGTFDLTARSLVDPLANRTGSRVSVTNNPSLGGLLALRGTLDKNQHEVRLAFFSSKALLEIADKNRINWSSQITPLVTYMSEETLWLAKKGHQKKIQDYSQFTISGSIADELEAKTVAHLFNKPYKIVTGYTGSAEYAAAVLRGEVLFFGPSRMTAARMMQSGDFEVALALSDKPLKDFSQAPYLLGTGGILEGMSLPAKELDQKKQVADHLIRIARSDRMVFISKHHPQKVQQCLEEFVSQSFKDPLFIQKISKMSLHLMDERSNSSRLRLKETDQSLHFLRQLLR